MSKVKEVEDMIFQNFADGEVHTAIEFKQKAIELEIINKDDKNSIRNTLYKIKNYSNVNAQGNGYYIIEEQEEKKEREDESDMTVEKAFIFLNERLKKIKKMDVIHNSVEELQMGKNEIDLYNKYTSEFNRTLNKN